MEMEAQLNYLHIAPRKVRLVANLIKGMAVNRAEFELGHLTKRSARSFEKLLRSAVANAKHNFHISGNGLYIKEIKVCQGPMLKRFTPRAFGRASPIRKRMSHIVLTLEVKDGVTAERLENRQGGPIARDIVPEDVAALPDYSKGAKTRPRDNLLLRTAGKKASKSREFVRRFFRRKAI